VQQHFAQVIEANFNSVSAERTIQRLSDRELASLAANYQAQAGYGNTRLLTILASRLSDQSLLRVASVFGKSAVEQAVVKNSSSAVKASFLEKESAIIPLVAHPMMPKLPPPAPPTTNWTNTINQIYLDYRTSPTLNMGTAESISASGLYTLGAVYGAWQVGTQIGNGISYLIENYDPSLSDAIGGTVANMIDAGNQAASELEQGHFQSSFDALFGFPISNSSDPSGPDGLTDPMLDYYDTYGPPTDDPGYGGGDGGCDNSPDPILY
jgi:hypothetical protein